MTGKKNDYTLSKKLGPVFWCSARVAAKKIKAAGGDLTLTEEGGLSERTFTFKGDHKSIRAIGKKLHEISG